MSNWSFHKIGCTCGMKADKNGPGCHTEEQLCIGCGGDQPCKVDKDKSPATWWMHQAISLRKKLEV